MTFAVAVSLLSGVAAVGRAAATTAAFGGGGVVVAVAVAAFALFASRRCGAWLQGAALFRRYARPHRAEVTARLVFIGRGRAARWRRGRRAVRGSPRRDGGAGQRGPVADRPHRRSSALAPRCWASGPGGPRPGTSRWSSSWLSVLTVADVVLVALLGTGTVAEAGFQALGTLAKAPVYVAVGTALVVFPMRRRRSGAAAARALRFCARPGGAGPGDRPASLRRSPGCVPAVAVVATVPGQLALLVLPADYAPSLALAAVAGRGRRSASAR